MAKENNKFPEESKRLEELYDDDQHIRIHGDFTDIHTNLEMAAKDLVHQAELEKILDKIGLPSHENISEKAAETVWLIAQHAGYDKKLMKRVLELMRETMKNDPSNGYYKGIPYLIDRINIMEGKDQLFGTQFWANPEGTPTPYPIEDEEKVENRRKKYGIRPFADYKKDVFEASSSNKRNVYLILY